MSLAPKILTFAVMMFLGGTAAAVDPNGPAVANPNSAAVGRAMGLLKVARGAARVSPNDRFIARRILTDSDGTEHVRLDRTYAGLPVIGGDVVVHSRAGRLKSVSLSQSTTLNLSTRPTVKAVDAIVHAGVEFGDDFIGRPSTSLVVYARNAGAPKLAWQVAFQGIGPEGVPSDAVYIVDAKNGKVLDRWSTIETQRMRGGICLSTDNTPATGTGKSLYSGNVAINTTACGSSFDLKDQTRGRNYTSDLRHAQTGKGYIFNDSDNIFGNNLATDIASVGVDAQYGAARTWDYFKNTHGRLGINNDGIGVQSRVQAGWYYANAFWSEQCFCMTYGDGNGSTIGPLVALDIAGHEISHGVNGRTAKLIYSGESGGLNEANSDILGTMVEFNANNPHDSPDYMIAEKIFKANVDGSPDQVALRYMFNPIKDGASPNCYSRTLGSLDVHYSSGVANRFFYLLAEGSGAKTFSGVNHAAPTCNGKVVTGITRAKAEKIWYRALTVYFTASTNYAGARSGTLNASNDLYGVNSAESMAVAASWSAVKVN